MNVTRMTLPTNQIEATTATQVRTKMHKDVIEAYIHDIKCGAIMPPLVVFAERESQRYILADGFHRLHAAVNADKSEVEIELHEGGMQEALMFALGANAGHGLRRTNADKRNAVKLALKNPEISQYQVQEIADICRVTVRTVQRIRTDLMLAETRNNRNDRTMSDSPKCPIEDDFRPSRPAPTQEEIDRTELRQALRALKAFPYDGDDTAKLKLTPDDIEAVNYCIDWLTKLLEKYVADLNGGAVA